MNNEINIPEFLQDKTRHLVTLDSNQISAIKFNAYNAGKSRGEISGWLMGFMLGMAITCLAWGSVMLSTIFIEHHNENKLGNPPALEMIDPPQMSNATTL